MARENLCHALTPLFDDQSQVAEMRNKVQDAAARKLQGAWRIKAARKKVSSRYRDGNTCQAACPCT